MNIQETGKFLLIYEADGDHKINIVSTFKRHEALRILTGALHHLGDPLYAEDDGGDNEHIN
jgi:hypothetical protein